MTIFDEAFQEYTASFASGGKRKEIPSHRLWVEIPPGVAAPGVFVRDGVEVGFWLLLESHSLRKEQSILQKAMGKRNEINVARGSAMVRDAIRAVADVVTEEAGDLKDSDEAREARMKWLQAQEREWLWESLSQRGRNLMARAYDELTEPTTVDAAGKP